MDMTDSKLVSRAPRETCMLPSVLPILLLRHKTGLDTYEFVWS